MKLPFQNAKVVGDNIDYETYAKQPVDLEATALALPDETKPVTQDPLDVKLVKRGDPRYVMSRGELMEFVKCPMKWLASPEKEITPSLKYGSYLDMLVLTPDKVDQIYEQYPETYVSERGEEKPWNNNANFCKDWAAKRSDKILIKKGDADEAGAAVERLFADDRIREFINCSKVQVMVTAEYVDAATGLIVPIRVLTDLVPDPLHKLYGKSLGDFKTSEDGHPNKWPKTVGAYAYHVQAALNLDLHTAATPEIERQEFRHLIQESSAPYQTGRRILSHEFIEVGRAKYMAALKFYCQCLKHKFWPDYETGKMVMNGWTITEPSQWDINASLDDERMIDFPITQQEAKTQNPDVMP